MLFRSRNWKTEPLRSLIKSTRYSILNLKSKVSVTWSWESEISLFPSDATLSSVDMTKSRPCWSNQSGRLAISYNIELFKDPSFFESLLLSSVHSASQTSILRLWFKFPLGNGLAGQGTLPDSRIHLYELPRLPSEFEESH